MSAPTSSRSLDSGTDAIPGATSALAESVSPWLVAAEVQDAPHGGDENEDHAPPALRPGQLTRWLEGQG
jgi:hypothetical protein